MKFSVSAILFCATVFSGSALANTPSEYKSVLELLETSYSKASCKSHVNIFHWRTTTDCTRPGGTATLVSHGVTGWDRKPVSLQVCEVGDMNKSTCKDITFSGNDEQDLLKAEQLLKAAGRARLQRGLTANMPTSSSSSSTNTEWDLLVRALELANQCTRHQIVLPPGPSTLILDCTHPGGTATLAGQAPVNNPSVIVPEYLKVCGIGGENHLDCQEVEFTGDLPTFFSRAKQMLIHN